LQNHPHWGNVGRLPFGSSPNEGADIGLNLLLGAPIGVGAALVFSHGVISAVLIALPVSLAGEWIQIYSHSRFPSATDVTLNVPGAAAAAIRLFAWTRRRAAV
jgi:glycopeptide antibiotics resistance protein